jgi:hypothetical protein
MHLLGFPQQWSKQVQDWQQGIASTAFGITYKMLGLVGGLILCYIYLKGSLKVYQDESTLSLGKGIAVLG